MPRTRPPYPPEFRREAIKLVRISNVRGGRRLLKLPQARAADELPRDGPLGDQLRPAAPARVDHPDRLQARSPAVGRGGWHYRKRSRIGTKLTERHAGQPPEAIAIAWSAQRRLHRTWIRLEQRNKRRTVIAVAAARELAGFCWAICQIE